MEVWYYLFTKQVPFWIYQKIHYLKELARESYMGLILYSKESFGKTNNYNPGSSHQLRGL